MKEFKVNLKPLIAKMELFSRKNITGTMTGEYRSVFKGSGLEFDRYRQYDATTDDASRIDWKVSQRARHLMVKEYVEERNANVVFMIDTSSSMSFGSTDKLKNEYTAELFATLAFAMLQTGDEIGLVLFNERLVTTLKPATGTKQYYLMIKQVTNPANYEGDFDFEHSIQQMMGWLDRPTTVIVMSDFIGLQPGWQERFEVFAVRHEVICFIIRDPRDLELDQESGDVMIEDPYSGDTLLINAKKVAGEYNKVAKADLRALQDLFKKYDCDSEVMVTDIPFKKPVMRFFSKRSMALR